MPYYRSIILLFILACSLYACVSKQSSKSSNTESNAAEYDINNSTVNVNTEKQKKIEVKKVKPAFKYGLGILTETKTISPDIDHIIVFKNGNTIEVPQQAFLNENGESITDSVSIVFTSFDTPGEVIVSGIPMAFVDDNGNHQQMVTGGMFEVDAQSNGKQVYLDPNKGLTINYASNNPEAFDFYQLDVAGDSVNWTNLTNKSFIPDDCKIPEGSSHFYLNFDTAGRPEFDILNKIKWEPYPVGTSERNILENKKMLLNNWFYYAIQPTKYAPKITKAIEAAVKSENFHYFKSPDGKGLITVQDKNYTFYDWKGNIRFQLTCEKKPSKYDFSRKVTFSENGNILLFRNSNAKTSAYLLTNDSLKLIKANLKGSPKVMSNDVIVSGNWTDKMQFHSTGGTLLYEHPESGGYSFSPNKEHALIHTNSGIYIFNNRGQQVAFLRPFPEVKEIWSYTYRAYFGDDEHISINGVGKNQYNIWKWKSNQFYTPPTEVMTVLDSLNFKQYFPFGKNKPFVFVQSKEKSLFWFWDEDKIIPLFKENSGTHQFYHAEVCFQEEYFGLGHMNKLFTLAPLENRDTLFLNSQTVHISKNNNLAVNYTEQEVYELYNNQGTKVRDFGEYSDLLDICSLAQKGDYFITKESGFGKVKVWSQEGKLLHSFTPKLDGENWTIEDKTVSNDGQYPKTFDVWNFKGEEIYSLYNYDRWDVIYDIDYRNTIVIDEEKDKIYFSSNREIDLPEDVYVLHLYTKSERFDTYVKTSPCLLKKLTDFNTPFEQRIRLEQKKQQVFRKFTKPFRVSNLGIYNWDKVLNKSDFKYCNLIPKIGNQPVTGALGFYHISGSDQNILIKYSPSGLRQFKWDPSSKNQIIAFLPDGKIGYASSSSIKKLEGNNLDSIKLQELEFELYNKEKSVEVIDYIIFNLKK
jgi:hypothetical protein